MSDIERKFMSVSLWLLLLCIGGIIGLNVAENDLGEQLHDRCGPYGSGLVGINGHYYQCKELRVYIK